MAEVGRVTSPLQSASDAVRFGHWCTWHGLPDPVELMTALWTMVPRGDFDGAGRDGERRCLSVVGETLGWLADVLEVRWYETAGLVLAAAGVVRALVGSGLDTPTAGVSLAVAVVGAVVTLVGVCLTYVQAAQARIAAATSGPSAGAERDG